MIASNNQKSKRHLQMPPAEATAPEATTVKRNRHLKMPPAEATTAQSKKHIEMDEMDPSCARPEQGEAFSLLQSKNGLSSPKTQPQKEPGISRHPDRRDSEKFGGHARPERQALH